MAKAEAEDLQRLKAEKDRAAQLLLEKEVIFEVWCAGVEYFALTLVVGARCDQRGRQQDCGKH